MTMTKGEGSMNLNDENKNASNEELLSALKSYQDKFAELEKRVLTGQASGSGFNGNDILTLAEAITSKTKKEINYKEGISVEAIPKNDYLEQDDWVRFCVPKVGYVLSDDKRMGHIVKLPYGKDVVFFEHLVTNKMQSGKNMITAPIAAYTSKSKAEVEWIRNHSLYGTLIFESSAIAASTNAEKALRLGKIMDLLRTWDVPNIVQSCRDHGIGFNENVEEMKKQLAFAMVEKQSEKDIEVSKKMAEDTWKDKLLIGRE